MVDVRPFKGLRFSHTMSGDLSDILCPPYDVISSNDQLDLHESSPYNMIRLELGKETPNDTDTDNRYTRSNHQLKDWIKKGILSYDDEHSMYLVEDEYTLSGKNYRLRGIFCAVRLESYKNNVILPHEETEPGPKEDRLKLMNASSANFSPLMALYKDTTGHISEIIDNTCKSDAIDTEVFHTSGHIYRIWKITLERSIQIIQAALRNQTIFIADGHHRYETAIKYRDQVNLARETIVAEDGHNFGMMCLVDLKDHGIQIGAFHRLLYSLSPANINQIEGRISNLFDLEKFQLRKMSTTSISNLITELDLDTSKKMKLALYIKDQQQILILTLKDNPNLASAKNAPIKELYECNTWLLHQEILETGSTIKNKNIRFSHDVEEIISELETSSCQGAIFLPPIKRSVFESIIRKGHRLPPKSTYFYPKIPSGIVINMLDNKILPRTEIDLYELDE